jgi:hypothetical protein
MASKTTLNAKNLEALGAERLAQLLIEVSTGNAAAKRKLQLALAGAQSPKEAGRAIAKRLTSIANGKSRISSKKRKAFVDDLETQRRGIVDQVGSTDPEEALLLMWRFLGLANPVIERCHGGDEVIIQVFNDACADLGALGAAGWPNHAMLVDSVFDALSDNRYGQYDRLISCLAPVLGAEGLEQLRQRFDALLNEQAAAEKAVNGPAGQSPADYVRGVAARRKQRIAKRALLELADAQGDVDAFIAQVEPGMRTMPSNAVHLARRLVGAGRATEAIAILDAADVADDDWDRMDWQDARLDVLERLGRREDAQAFRWACFERDLSAEYLRAYLSKLPDFEDIEAEERAVAFAMGDPDLLAALQFFLDWRSPARAAQLLVRRHAEIDGNAYEILSPAADALAEGYPLAATLALRAMIDFTLRQGRSKRYRHAARHLATCAEFASRVEEFGAFETHEAYVARLKKHHSLKLGFWSLVSA